MSQYLIFPINDCKNNASYKNAAYRQQFGFTHYGCDFISTKGIRTLYGSGNGTVVGLGKDNVVGNLVAVVYPMAYNRVTKKFQDVCFRYFHLESISVKIGDKITKDTKLGIYGNTGQLSTGAHLHLEVDTDTKSPLYSPTVASSNILKGRNVGANDKTMSSPIEWLHTKIDAPDNQTYITANDKYINDDEKTVGEVDKNGPVKNSSTTTPTNSKKIIVIDAGHGGTDPGAVGNNLKESNLTLSISKYVKEILDKDINYTALLTRSTETNMTVDARWQFANNNNASLFFSVHFNAASGTIGEGWECYPQVPGETYHIESLKFARILSNKFKSIQKLRGIDGVRFAYNNSGTLKFADSNDKNLNKYTSYYGIVRNSKCPVLLAETAFINNPTDIEKFNTEDELKNAANLYYQAICEYFGTKPIQLETPKSMEEIIVENVFNDGIIDSTTLWLEILQGKKTPTPEQLKLVLEKYHTRLNAKLK